MQSLRWRLFTSVAVWGRAQCKQKLKLAVIGKGQRAWWLQILEKLTSHPTCRAVRSLSA